MGRFKRQLPIVCYRYDVFCTIPKEEIPVIGIIIILSCVYIASISGVQ